ncbi:hypothetical protein BU25DRAFT_33233 [Macroventuria anomochaeta]|uniref:Uncharacterized protein n=1 Tax=Macroventuria anomochaeta TaxID=301207 RepID=A0ACB6S4H1_9PLEO|nr:uncharacterized protein BU25DRAFT_33233 [Macroventuria anomochaeta]KAF2628858.1 hypothetical protein BU25DRAFT_33233 [Macroventuria anomochaeta]
MSAVRYYKLQSQWDRPKVVPRFLLPRQAQVMVMYLAYLQPFQEYLIVQMLGGSFSNYVWADEQGLWGTDQLTRALRRETGKRFGVKLHTRLLDYRHTAVDIDRVVVGESFSKSYQDKIGEVDEAKVDEDGEDVMELQNARTTAMGVGNYTVPTDIVRHFSVRSIEVFRPLSTMWRSTASWGLRRGESAARDMNEQRRSEQKKEETRAQSQQRH